MNEKRHRWTVFAFASVLVVLLGWQAYHAVIDRYFLQDQGRLRIERTQEVPVQRGVIYDRHGEALAISTPVSAISVDPSRVNWSDSDYRQVAKLLATDVHQLKALIGASNSKSFIYLARRQSIEVGNSLRSLRLPELTVQTEYRRYYPMAEVAAHVTGITDIDETGIEGLEKQFNKHLTGEKGLRRVARDNEGRLINDVRYTRMPEFGEDLHTTIDRRLQFLAYSKLKQTVDEYKAKSASLVLLEVETGGILAMANLPSYNPNAVAVRPWSNMRNRAVTDLVEPGSTFKPFVVMEALESGLYTPSFEINTSPGWTTVRYKTIKDPRDYGVLTLEGVLVKSSQVGATKLALQLPENAILNAYERAGYQSHVSSGLPGEALGGLSGDDTTKVITRATMSYGYGFSVTPLQLAQSYLTLATGGVRRQITILKDDPRAVDEQRVYSLAQSRAMLNMLKGVTGVAGTASSAKIDGFSVAGKTGTVRNTDPAGGYSETDHTTLFVGMVPAEFPEYLAVVVVVSPKPKAPGQKVSGGSVSAPVFKHIATRTLQLQKSLQIDSEWVASAGSHGT